MTWIEEDDEHEFESHYWHEDGRLIRAATWGGDPRRFWVCGSCGDSNVENCECVYRRRMMGDEDE